MSLPTWLNDNYGVPFIVVQDSATLVEAVGQWKDKNFSPDVILIVAFPEQRYHSIMFGDIASLDFAAPVTNLPLTPVTGVYDNETSKHPKTIEEELISTPEGVIIITVQGQVSSVLYNPSAATGVTSLLQEAYERFILGVKTDEVMFSAIYPPSISPGQTRSFFVYAHLSDELAAVLENAQTETQALGEAPPVVKPSEKQQLRQGSVLTVYLQSEQQAFKPIVYRQVWNGSWVRFEFEFVADKHLIGKDIIVQVIILSNSLEIATIKDCKIEITVDLSLSSPPLETTPGYLYNKIFVSYAREDAEIVEQYRLWQQARGDDVIMDIEGIPNDKNGNDRLKQQIEVVDIFQLFWSQDAKESEPVTDEWQHALKIAQQRNQDGSGFIRPVYWTNPLPLPPEELKHLRFMFLPLDRGSITGHPNDILLEEMRTLLRGEFASFSTQYSQILDKLDSLQKNDADLKDMMTALQSGYISEADMQEFLSQVQQSLAPLQHQAQFNQDMQSALTSLKTILEANVGLQQKFELTVPLIPNLLGYKLEGTPEDIRTSMRAAFDLLRTRVQVFRSQFM